MKLTNVTVIDAVFPEYLPGNTNLLHGLCNERLSAFGAFAHACRDQTGPRAQT